MNNDILSPLHCCLNNHLLHHRTNPSVIQPHCESLRKVSLVCPIMAACLYYLMLSIRGFFTYATCWIIEKVPSSCMFRFSASFQKERKRNDKKQRMRQATFVSTLSPTGGANVIMGRASRGVPVLCQDDCYVSLKQEKERSMTTKNKTLNLPCSCFTVLWLICHILLIAWRFGFDWKQHQRTAKRRGLVMSKFSAYSSVVSIVL